MLGQTSKHGQHEEGEQTEMRFQTPNICTFLVPCSCHARNPLGLGMASRSSSVHQGLSGSIRGYQGPSGSITVHRVLSFIEYFINLNLVRSATFTAIAIVRFIFISELPIQILRRIISTVKTLISILQSNYKWWVI